MQKLGNKNYLDIKFYYLITLLKTINKVLEFILPTCILYFVKLYYFLLFIYIKSQKSSLAKYFIYYLIENAYVS